MKRRARTVMIVALASAALGGCGPHLKKLGVCSTGPYRYANPKGVSLPSLSVPTPEDLNGPAPASPDAATGGTPPSPAPTPAPAPAPTPDPGATQPAPADNPPVASPPKRGAMLMPRSTAAFGSC